MTKRRRRRGSPEPSDASEPANPVEALRGKAAASPTGRPKELETVGDFPLLVETPPPGLVGRYFVTQKHTLGLIFGGLNAWVRSRHAPYPRGYGLARIAAFFTRPFVRS